MGEREKEKNITKREREKEKRKLNRGIIRRGIINNYPPSKLLKRKGSIQTNP